MRFLPSEGKRGKARVGPLGRHTCPQPDIQAMLRAAMRNNHRRRKQNYRLSLMSLLFAMVVQFAYMPFHFAYEEHDGISGALAQEGGADAFVAACIYGHDHGQPSDGHPCHAVQDHGGEFMVPSMSSSYKALASDVLLSEEAWFLPSSRVVGWCRPSKVGSWCSFGGFGGYTRGPPAAV